MSSLNTLSMPKKVLRYLRDPSVSLWRKLAGLWAVLYTLSPIDAVPDMIPLIGWLDDVGVISFTALFIMREVASHSALRDTPPKNLIIEGESRGK